MTIFSRSWAMPNSATFEIEPIAKFVGRYLKIGQLWVDPFARSSRFSKFCKFTNDLCPDFKTTHNMEALDFLISLRGQQFDGVIFDPPYSPRQISEAYSGVGRDVHISDTQSSFYSDRKNAAAQIIKPGGFVLSFGWSSNGFGLSRGFEIEEILLVAHGSAHNDTVCVAERKKSDLLDMIEAQA